MSMEIRPRMGYIKAMKLSFIIPAYNEESYIGKSLESIQREIKGGEYDVEIIVVNNASTDATKKVALSFSGVRVIDETKKGLLHARQAGFLASTGDFIIQLDADTIICAGWLKTALSEFAKNPKLVAASGPVIYYDLPPISKKLTRLGYHVMFVSYLMNRFILRVGSMLQGGLCIIRRSALEQVGGYNSEINFYGEDTDLARRLQTIGPVKFTFKLPTYSSGRRVAIEGFWEMARRYYVNHIWITFMKRSYTNEYLDIRTTVDSNNPISLFQFKPELKLHRQFIVGIILIIAFLGVVAGVQASHDAISDSKFVQTINNKVRVLSDKASRMYNYLDSDTLNIR